MDEITTGVATAPDGGAAQAAESPTASQGSGVASTEQQIAGDVTAPVQGSEPTQPSDDPLAGLPTVEEIEAEVAKGTPYAKGLAQLRGAYEPLKTQFGELETKFKPFETVADRFESPEAVQSVLDLHDSLIGWENDPVTGQLIPATESGAEKLTQLYPQHADYLTADLLNGMTRDDSGRTISRIDLALESMARNPERRAAALRILGGVEPSSITPQWQPTAEELEVVRPELQDIYKKMPYDEREALKLNEPDYINRILAREKYTQGLEAEREQTQQQQVQQQQQREQYRSEERRVGKECRL